MRILILGASGLIGRHLALALLAQHHQVTGLCRHPDRRLGQIDWYAADLLTMPDSDLRALCLEHDCVVMCVGIFDEHPGQTFLAIHQQAAQKVFSVCEQTKSRLLHFSALGAHHRANNYYARSKGWADQQLQTRDFDACIVRPSLVFAERGRSTQFFCSLALSPLLILPKTDALIQPIHMDDLVAHVCRLINKVEPVPAAKIVEMVGPKTLTFADYLNGLRRQLLGKNAILLSVPAAWFYVLLKIKPRVVLSLFTTQSLDLMQHDNIASEDSHIKKLVGEKSPDQFVSNRMAAFWQRQFSDFVTRIVLSFIWLFTALVSVINFEQSQTLIRALPLSENLQMIAIFAGAALDAVLGVLTWCWPCRRLWQLQIGVIVIYTVLISLFDPIWWLHPYGALSKNLAVLWLLVQLLRDNNSQER